MPNKNENIEKITINVVDVDSDEYKTLEQLKKLFVKESNHYEKQFSAETNKMFAEFQATFRAEMKKKYKVDVKKGERVIFGDDNHQENKTPPPKSLADMLKMVNQYYLKPVDRENKINPEFRSYLSMKDRNPKHDHYAALYFKRKIFRDLFKEATNKQHTTPKAALAAINGYLEEVNNEALQRRNSALSQAIASVLVKIAEALNTTMGKRAHSFFRPHTEKTIDKIKSKVKKEPSESAPSKKS